MQNSSSKFIQILLIGILIALLFIIAKPWLSKNDISVEQELVSQEVTNDTKGSDKSAEVVQQKQTIPDGYVQYTDSENGFSFWYPKNIWGELVVDRTHKRDGTQGQFTFETSLKSPLFFLGYGGATQGFNLRNPNEGGRETVLSDYSQTMESFKKLAVDSNSIIKEFVTNEGVKGIKIEDPTPAADCDWCFFSDFANVYFFELKKYPGGIYFQFPKNISNVDEVMKTLSFSAENQTSSLGGGTILTQDQAQEIIEQTWSDCSGGDCSGVEVTFEPDFMNQYLITAIFTEYDDSVSQTKRQLLVKPDNGGGWIPTTLQPNPNEWRTCHRGNSDGSLGWTTGNCI